MPEFHRPITPGTPQGRSVGLEGSIHARPTGDESPSVSIVGSARRSQTSMSRQRSSRKDPHRRDDCTRTPTKAGCISIIGSAELRSPTGRGPATPANSVALEQSIYALPPGANQTPLSERPEFRLRSPTAAKSQVGSQVGTKYTGDLIQ
ncbi:hypothetical protein IWQ60_007150 [Tieghemiomyces parasiticus]|uniref:Uncharacterized protein n=1 Tax=Tieghemiomyces parasiticus TaxID=78921 RepID=A0A9W8A7E3_9FUNG|nr:hypothetical protein IWQ60_007150 [Tieghemiomyces parasiticus]